MTRETSKVVSSQKGLRVEDIENQIQNILFEIIDETNDRLPEDERIEKEKSTQLYGEGAALDSMEFVNFIVAFEQRIQSDLDVTVNLEEETAEFPGDGPFRSIETLAAYATKLIKEKIDGQ